MKMGKSSRIIAAMLVIFLMALASLCAFHICCNTGKDRGMQN